MQINTLAESAVTPDKWTNPYKFSVKRTASTSTSAGLQRLDFDTKIYDTSNNYNTSTFRFTAPVTGYYQFDMGVAIAVKTPTRMFPAFYKNGVEHIRGVDIASACQGVSLSGSIYLTSGDYVESWLYIDVAGGTYHGATSFFDGFIISKT